MILNLQLIDVREPEEVAIASVATFTILPLSQYQEWSPTIATQFNPQAETLVICHHGMRIPTDVPMATKSGFY
jgi:rhodanese-related sulfurtransferase